MPSDPSNIPPIPSGHYAHADPHIDSVIRDLVVNHRCEVVDDPRHPEWIHVECGCPGDHLMTVELVPTEDEQYPNRMAADLRAAFTCC